MENPSSSGVVQDHAHQNLRQLRDRNPPIPETDLAVQKTAATQAHEPHQPLSRKRRRSVLSSPVRTQKQTVSRSVPLGNRRHGRSEAGPSDAPSFLFDTSEPAPKKGLKAPAYDDSTPHTSHKARVSAPGVDDTLDGAEAQLRALQQCLRDAEAQLDKERSQRFERERQVRQDMYLEMLQAKETSQRTIEKLGRHLRIAGKLMDERDEAMRDLRQRFESTSESLSRQIVEMDSQRQELQHLQALNTTLEGDIEELRQIQNEVPGAKRPPGLPPAYGRLAEEDLPPYELHKDTGALTLATFKRAVRERFNVDVRQVVPCCDGSRFSIEPSATPGAQTFHRTSYALYKAVSTVKTVMERWHSSYGFNVDLFLEGSVRRSYARWSFLASRLANLIVELGWRTVSLNEVRPTTGNFSARALSVQKTMYSHVDDVLLQALRHWNGEGTTNSTSVRQQHQDDHRAEEFQVYLSQLTALASRLRQLLYRSRNKREMFTKSISFLQEAGENERMQQANRSPERDDGLRVRDPSVISSVGVPENSDSEDDGLP